MKQYILKKRIFAVLFLLVLLPFSGYNLWCNYDELAETVAGAGAVQPAKLEAAMNDGLYGRMNFIETYGLVQLLLDKREVNNFDMIKDEKGYLQYASFFREEDAQLWTYAQRVKRLQDAVAKNGTKVLFVVTPSKYIAGETPLRTGLQANDPASRVNELLFDLNRLGVETLNLGEYLPGAEMPYEQMFFKTDHHWTVPAAFAATKVIVEALNDRFGMNLDPDGRYTDPARYESVTYRGGMMGSMGRRTGAVYVGMDDFTALWPNFEGHYEREFMNNDGAVQRVEGNFVDALMNVSALQTNGSIYTSSQYSLYLNELKIYEKIKNTEQTDGAKIMMIRDSYFSPVIAFLMPMCGEIDAIWSLEDTDKLDIESYVKENQFDTILIQVYPYNITSDAFRYFEE